jgi:phage recombination protein Bet
MKVSTELSRRPSEALVTSNAQDQWTDRQIALISRTVANGASPEELHLFLNIAARYNLDPIAGEIWCVKTRGRNGGEGRIAIIVGEQGRLKIAERFEDYRGFRSGVVCENDRFMKKPQAEELVEAPGTFSYVEHSFGHPNERGAVVGGWCEVYRVGRPPTFFYAPLSEYMPNPEGMSAAAIANIPWFKTESRMIEKCSISTGFRMAFNLAGLYGEEEMEHVQKAQAAGTVTVEDEIEWGESVEMAELMQSMVTAANNAKPGAYPPAKVRLLLAGLTDDERTTLIQNELVPFIVQNDGTVPQPGETVVADDDVSIEHEPESEAAGAAAEADVDIPFGEDEQHIPGV